MSVIGVIYCGFNCADLIEQSLTPWVEARATNLGGNQYLICCTSVPFLHFGDGRAHDSTHLILNEKWANREIDHIISHEIPTKETAARGEALKWLVGQGCDTLIQVDSDESHTLDEINRIFTFVAARPEIAAFRGSLKNWVEIGGTRGYLAEPFTPMRIHRVRHNTFLADSFWDDNNVLYRGTLTRNFMRDVDLPVLQIPKSVAWVSHETWPSNHRGELKSKYQLARGWTPSYLWDEEENMLVFNPAVPVPEIVVEE